MINVMLISLEGKVFGLRVRIIMVGGVMTVVRGGGWWWVLLRKWKCVV